MTIFISLSRFLPHSLVAALLLLPFFGTVLSAQNEGWNLLRANDHRAARAWFEEKLADDSLDLPSLQGMIILSDIQGDGLNYREYVTRLVQTTWSDNEFVVFRDVLGLSDTTIVASPLSISARLRSMIGLATELKYRYRTEEAASAYRKLSQEGKWSLIGPFENVGGSGYAVDYPVEKGGFQERATYQNEIGVPIVWHRPENVDPSGLVSFDYFLEDGDRGVCYANTFLTLPSDQTLQFRLSRSSPVKLWVDDDLVYADPEVIGFQYDGEIISLPMKAGTHRLLIKLAPFFDDRDEYNLLDVSVPQSPNRKSALSDGSIFSQGMFFIRFTDESGALPPGVVTSYSGKYSPTDYRPVISNHQVVDYYLKKVGENPDDLFSLYLLHRAFMKSGEYVRGEEFFTRRAKSDSTIALRWMLAKMYGLNGKLEKIYSTLQNVDTSRAPIFGLLYEKLGDIDRTTEDEEFVRLFQQLRTIAPSDFGLIRQGLRYYSEKDQKGESDQLIDRVIADYPEYKEYLEQYRSDYAYRGDVDDRSPREIIDSLMESVNNRYSGSAFEQLIDYYTDKKEVDTVVSLYQRQIELFPWVTYYRRQLATYLKEEKRYEEAIALLQQNLKLLSNSPSTYEMIGDVYLLMGKKEDALKEYRAGYGVDLNGYSHQTGYRENSLIQKIENIQTPVRPDSLFTGGLLFEKEIGDEEWKEKYDDEESVIQMYDKRQVLDSYGRIRTWSRMMVRILTEAGADWWTEYDFGMLGSLNKVRIRKSSGAEISPDRRGSMVVFKNLEPGDVIMLEGSTEETIFDDQFDGEYFDISFLTFGAPIHRARIEVLTPKGRPLYHLTHQLDDNLHRATRGTYDSYVWSYSDIDRMPDEDAMIDGWDGFQTIFISTMPDWHRVVEWYTSKTYRRTEPTYDVKAIADSLVTSSMSQREKIEAVYNYVTRTINYSHVPFLQSAYTPKAADLTLSSAIGDCKDVATLMITMLNHVGIESWYTLVKTNAYSHQRFLPSHLFDHVIVGVEIDGNERYMDLTTNYFPSSVLPYNDCGAWGLKIRNGETEVFQLPLDHVDPTKNLIALNIEASLDTSRAIRLNVDAEHTGLEGAYIRESIGRMSKEEFRNRILEMFGRGTFQDLRLVDFRIANRQEMNQPLRSTYSFNGERFSDRVSNLYIFRLPWMLSITNNSALKTAKRVTSLDVSSLCEAAPSRQVVQLTFPAGFEMTELPDDITIESEFGRYEVRFREREGGVEVEKYQQFYTTVIPPDQFQEFREFYLRLLDLDEARYAIILRNDRDSRGG